MKTSLLKITAAAVLGFAASVGTAAAKPLIGAVDTAFVPFEFKQGDEYVGFDIDLWDLIANELDVEYELRPMDFSGILPALQTDNVDVALAGITITEERQKAIDFSDGYYDRSEERRVGKEGVSGETSWWLGERGAESALGGARGE